MFSDGFCWRLAEWSIWCIIVEIEHDCNWSVPSVAEPVPGEEVLQMRASVSGVVDTVQMKLSDRMAKVELLGQVIILGLYWALFTLMLCFMSSKIFSRLFPKWLPEDAQGRLLSHSCNNLYQGLVLIDQQLKHRKTIIIHQMAYIHQHFATSFMG